MVRQYVGARYVPKFADPTAWASGTSYEAMTIVTYNNSSYTSKITVPATVGNPADNPDYWALTGNYNAQVEQYRQEVENVKINYSKCFNTAANMIADTSLTEGTIVKTLGYNKIADNGGAFYKIYNTKEQNSEHYENLSNGKYALLIPNGYITPQMFGAIGDGVADDTISIQNALNSGKPVYIPSGTYLVSGITIPNKCMVFGNGRNTIIQGNGTNHTIIIPSSSSYCELTSLTVYGIEGNTLYNAVEISDKNSEDADVVFDASHVINDVMTKYGNYGIRIGSSVRGCRLTNLTISHATNDGLHIDGTDNSVINGSMSYCGRHGLYINQNNRIASIKPFLDNGYGIYIEGLHNNLTRIDIQQTSSHGVYIKKSNNYIQFVSDGVGFKNSNYKGDISLIVFGADARFNMILGTIRNGTLWGMMNHIVSVEENGHPFGNIIDVIYCEEGHRFPIKDIYAVNGILDPSNTYRVNGCRIYSDFDLNIPSQANLVYHNTSGNTVNTTPIDFDTFGTTLTASGFAFDSVPVEYGISILFRLKHVITARYVYFRAYVTSNIDISEKTGYVIRTYDASGKFVTPNYYSKPSDGYIEGYYVFNDATRFEGVRLGLMKATNDTITTPATVEFTVKEVEIWTR